MPTIRSSVNRDFLVAPSSSAGTTTSSFSWFEKNRAGQAGALTTKIAKINKLLVLYLSTEFRTEQNMSRIGT
jgi:hypothetical protein